MTRPLRAADFAPEDRISSGTSPGGAPMVESGRPVVESLEHSIVGRVAQAGVVRLSAAARWRPEDTANGSIGKTGKVDLTSILGLSEITRAKRFIEPSMNEESTKKIAYTLIPIQEWEGYVVEIIDNCMRANVIDLSSRSERASASVDIPLNELSSDQVEKLKPGMIFRWSVGYLRMPGGTRVRGSNIVFRDLPQWTRRELQEAKALAAELAEYFRSDDESNSSPGTQLSGSRS